MGNCSKEQRCGGPKYTKTPMHSLQSHEGNWLDLVFMAGGNGSMSPLEGTNDLHDFITNY